MGKVQQVKGGEQKKILSFFKSDPKSSSGPVFNPSGHKDIINAASSSKPDADNNSDQEVLIIPATPEEKSSKIKTNRTAMLSKLAVNALQTPKDNIVPPIAPNCTISPDSAPDEIIPGTPVEDHTLPRKNRQYQRSYLGSITQAPSLINNGKVTKKTKATTGVSLEQRLKMTVTEKKADNSIVMNPLVLSEIGQSLNPDKRQLGEGFLGKRVASHRIAPNPKRLAQRKTPKKTPLENRYTREAKARNLFPSNQTEDFEPWVDSVSDTKSDEATTWGLKSTRGGTAKPVLQSSDTTHVSDDMLCDILDELKSSDTTSKLPAKKAKKPDLDCSNRVEDFLGKLSDSSAEPSEGGFDEIMKELREQFVSPSKRSSEDPEKLKNYNSIINFTPKTAYKSAKKRAFCGKSPRHLDVTDGNSGLNQPGIETTSGLNQPGIETTSGLNQPGIETTSGFNQSGMETTSGLNQPGIETTSGLNQPGIETTSGLNQPGIETTSGLNQTGIETTSGLNQPGIETTSGLNQPGIETMDIENSSETHQETATRSDSQELAVNFEKFSPFKKHSSKEVGDDEIPKFYQYGRHRVLSVLHERSCVVLELTCEVTGQEVKVVLEGFWMDTHIKEGDVVNVLGDFDEDGVCHVTDQRHLVVVEPDQLVSGTSIVSALHCMRRSVLNEVFKASERSLPMLHGSVIHHFFQQVLVEKAYSPEAMETVAKETVTQNKFLHEMYGLGVSEVSVKEEIDKLTPHMTHFIQQHVVPGNKVSEADVHITDIADIEENIWSPRFGVKGKIDLTVGVKIRPNRKSRWEEKILPLELKTGRASFSAEHKGQVVLYSMLSSDRRVSPDSGLLLYIKQGRMETVPADTRHQSGLMQLRNEMVHYLRGGCLPAPINSPRSCAACPALTTCTAYMRSIEDYTPPPGHAMASLAPATLSHLSQQHLDYFAHWCRLLDLEKKTEVKKGHGVHEIWCKTAKEREQHGTCVGGLQLVAAECSQLAAGLHLMIFTRHRVITGCVVNDSVVVSAQNKPLVSLCSGSISQLSPHRISITTDRDLRLYRDHTDTVYRLDKVDTYNTMAINYSNLSLLLTNNTQCERLRGFVIDKKKPEFELTFSHDKFQKVKDLFKPLNKPQKSAILKVLMCKDYVLIKGFPGTGKTSTIVTLVRVLSRLGVSVLLTSYTHSAVDNILLKLIQFGCEFVRLGRLERIHPDVRSRSAEQLTRHMTSTSQLAELYENVGIVATTCLGVSSHPVFSRRRFDVVIVDEATQVLQPACLRALSLADKFVLVGDPLQLPPVVRSQQAKEQGMTESLFLRLDDTGATYELNLQYRMNSAIMRLSNELVYDGALQCGNDQVAEGRILLNNAVAKGNHPHWLSRVLSNEAGEEVVVLDTDAVPCIESSGVTNTVEAALINRITHEMIQSGLGEHQLGVIAPYQHQVSLVRDMLASRGHCKVEVNTVDQYQGRDKDVIVISFVKTKQGEGAVSEILQDVRRLNVAVTRPRHKLVLLCSVTALSQYTPCHRLLNIIQPQHITQIPDDVDLQPWMPSKAALSSLSDK